MVNLESSGDTDLNIDKETSNQGVSSKFSLTRRHPNECVIGNTLLIWLGDHANEEHDDDYRHMIKKLERLMNKVQPCSDHNFFLYLVNTTTDKELFVIIPGYVGERIVPLIHNKKYLNSIYILCGDKVKHERWAKEWSKIKGVFTEISSIHEVLKETVRQWEENTIEITLTKVTHRFPGERDWEPLENLKEALLAIEFKDQHLKDFIDYYRKKFVDDEYELNNTRQLEHEYHNRSPIWWYTFSNSLYSMLNRALRTVEIDIMIKMGFLLRDLHYQIQQLHSEQFSGDSTNDTFTVNRGQGLSKEKFKRLTQNKTGLIVFHNFLSTSKDQKVSLELAQQATINNDLIGILFTFTVEPHQSTACCASIGHASYSRDDNEVLFSMFTIFRIIDIKSINNNKRLHEVHLAPLNDNDPDLHKLTCRRQLPTPTVFSKLMPWNRLGRVFTEIREFDKAEEFYNMQLNQTTDDNDKGHIYQELAWNKYQQGKLNLAIELYEKAIDIYQSMHPPSHGLAEAFINIGYVYKSQGDYTKALPFQEKAIAIQQELLPLNHSDLARSFDTLGELDQSMQDYPKALSSYEKALEIREQTQPPDPLGLADSYDQFGSLHTSMGDFAQALSFHEQAMQIREQALPRDHFELAKSYKNLAHLYFDINDIPKGLFYDQKADQIRPMNDDSEDYRRMVSSFQNMNNNQN
ncbi:unnamed protein product [Adineta steineri]|uniref:NAD(P)(+)--arginine ADP-ribosyltransferase n=1 Tax=Adineta steineri TaxID=433720 RepID=A0A819IQF2_9BILA|nr:unnamed protein product [Adineta steineri]CAF3920397.1 unnamed protein product [Adineta steineri]